MADDIAQELSQELDGLYGSDTEPAQPAQPIKADYTSMISMMSLTITLKQKIILM